jgi:pimeloyl-ACP methyl ester carboxylesterase
MRLSVLSPVLGLIVFTSVAWAEVHQATIPLHDGRVHSEDLILAALQKLHLPGVAWGSLTVDLSALEGSDVVTAVNESLGAGGHIEINSKQLTLSIDPEYLPCDCDGIKHAIRVFTENIAPAAYADQRRSWGLVLPAEVDPSRRMIVLVHGLDCNRSNWSSMADLLGKEGYQVAYFAYPSDGPIETSVSLLAREMKGLHQNYPKLPVSILAHSMGGLVARAYIEGPAYAGNVDQFIMLGTPNQGSRWAAYRMALEIREHYGLWKSEPNWRLSWMITDGLGEAGRDLRPKSAFLTKLNSLPRRAGVGYTIIAGDHNLARRIEADALDGTANIIPERLRSWWGVRQINSGLHNAAECTRETTGQCDGPVAVKSTELQGVSDHVTLHADHNALYISMDGRAPAAWGTIRERLALVQR